jgi:hypothetical protein
MIKARGRTRKLSPAVSESEGALAALAEEMATFRDHLPQLLQRHEGHYVLIKGMDIVEVFRDRSKALREGYERFGLVPFLVRQIASPEPVVYLPNVVP